MKRRIFLIGLWAVRVYSPEVREKCADTIQAAAQATARSTEERTGTTQKGSQVIARHGRGGGGCTARSAGDLVEAKLFGKWDFSDVEVWQPAI